ncbi:hypothetical protein [Allorhizocola rhizosphaerae]|uniref:hypothetical protein n=1 Tax=Allorhizocola rhizosphaerae TaxID=1872709 RepID=UPI000E3E3B39|nr:hypothetical protein [Allorhizocola rhizosphaerae]
MSRIWAAIVTGFLATFVLPAAAWAEETGVADTLRRGPRISGIFGFFAAACCLVVVVGVVLLVVMLSRRRR